MAQQLWFLRHGEAVPHGSKPDAERELTPRGERQSTLAGRGLAKLNLEFAACYSSPKVRARDTARLACEELGVEPQIEESLSDGFGRSDARDLLHAHDDGDRVLFVGHEPDFSQVVQELTGARIDMKKGGAAAVKVEGSQAELIVLLRPRELESLAGGDV